MGLLKFELKKIVKQKKLIWLLVIIFLVSSGMFLQNYYHRGGKVQRALDEVMPLINEWEFQESDLIEIRKEYGLTEMQEKQLEHSREMGAALDRWRIAVSYELWDEINIYQQRFLTSLQEFIDSGGQFRALSGVEFEIAQEKNTWMLEYNLPYEVESYPLSSHLFLKESTAVLLSILGIVILILFYGNSITMEKEQQTWLTLRTQPAGKIKIILTKYASLMMVAMIYIVTIICLGLLMTTIFGEQKLSYMYPQIITTGETFIIYPLGEHLLKTMVYFFCSLSLVFSISLSINSLVKRTYSVFLLTGLLLPLGYYASTAINIPLNPFTLFNLQQFFSQVSQTSQWHYIISSLLFSGLFLTASIPIPEQEYELLDLKHMKQPFLQGKTRANSNTLRNIWMFEWRKLWREGLVKQLSIFLVLIILGGYFTLFYHANQREQLYIEEIKYRKELVGDFSGVQEMIDDLKNRRDEEGVDFYDSDIDMLKERLEAGHLNYEMVNVALTAYEDRDWMAFHEYQLFLNRERYEQLLSRDFDRSTTLGYFTYEVSIAEKQWLIDRGIPMVFSGEYIPTIYQDWISPSGEEFIHDGWGGELVTQDRWEYENKKVDSSGLFSLHLAYEHYICFLPLLLLLPILGLGFAAEEGKRSTINLLKTQPITEQQLYIGKLLNGFTVAISALAIIILLLVLLGTVSDRFGDWEYPILHYNSPTATDSPDYSGSMADGKGYHFITLGRYLINSTALLMPLTLFFISLSIFISLFIKSSLGVLAITVLVGGGGYWLSEQLSTGLAHLLPFTYFNIPKVVNGEIATLQDNPSVNVLTGVLVLLVLTSMLVAGGHYILRVKTGVNVRYKKRGEKHDLIG